MNTAHEELAAIAREGAQRFSSTGLASSHASVTRRVRRHRVARGSVTAVAGVGIVGAGAFGVVQLRGADAVGPAGTSPSSSPVPSAEATAPSEEPEAVGGVLEVSAGDHADAVIARLAEMYGTDVETARTHVIQTLPDEAQGEPEGWIAEGRYATWAESGEATAGTLTQQASAASRSSELYLDLNGVPREQWLEVVTIASIVEAEAAHSPAEDMAGIATVIRNRLDQDMRLEIESPLRYYEAVNGLEPSDESWAIDTPYNTFMYGGLPPTPIGAPSPDAIEAAAEPADADWLYYVHDSATGRMLFAATFEEHLENVEAIQAQLQQGEG